MNSLVKIPNKSYNKAKMGEKYKPSLNKKTFFWNFYHLKSISRFLKNLLKQFLKILFNYIIFLGLTIISIFVFAYTLPTPAPNWENNGWLISNLKSTCPTWDFMIWIDSDFNIECSANKTENNAPCSCNQLCLSENNDQISWSGCSGQLWIYDIT
jgi:hypothetical protein